MIGEIWLVARVSAEHACARGAVKMRFHDGRGAAQQYIDTTVHCHRNVHTRSGALRICTRRATNVEFRTGIEPLDNTLEATR